MAWISVLSTKRGSWRGGGEGGDGGKADLWTGVGLRSSGMQMDREGGREAAKARPTQARNLQAPVSVQARPSQHTKPKPLPDIMKVR